MVQSLFGNSPPLAVDSSILTQGETAERIYSLARMKTKLLDLVREAPQWLESQPTADRETAK